MKTTREMTESVLKRIHEHEEKRKKRQKVFGAVFSFAAIAAVAATAVILAQKNAVLPPETVLQTGEISAPASGERDQTPTELLPEIKGGHSISWNPETPEDRIVIAKLDEAPYSDKMYGIARRREDFLPMTPEKAEEYYGVGLQAIKLPDGIKMDAKRSEIGLYRRDGGTGEVYWDQSRVLWTDGQNDGERGAVLHLSREFGLFFDVRLPEEQNAEPSLIRGAEVWICSFGENGYLAKWKWGNTDAMLVSEGLDEEEFLTALTSLFPEMS